MTFTKKRNARQGRIVVSIAEQQSRLGQLIHEGLEIACKDGRIHETHAAHFREDGAGHFSCCAISLALLASVGGRIQMVREVYESHESGYLSAVAKQTGVPTKLISKVDHRYHYFATPSIIISKILMTDTIAAPSPEQNTG